MAAVNTYGYPTFSQMQRDGYPRPSPQQVQQRASQNPYAAQTASQFTRNRPRTPYAPPAPSASQPVPGQPATIPPDKWGGGATAVPLPPPRTEPWGGDGSASFAPPTPKTEPWAAVSALGSPAGATGGAGGGFDPSAILRGILGAPNRFSGDMAVGTFDRLNRRLGEEFGVAQRRLTENLTSRGLGDSSIFGDRFSDLATEQARSQAELAQQIQEQAAQQDWQDRLAALQAYSGIRGQQFNEDLATANLNDSRENRQLELLLRLLLGAQ